MPKFAFFFTLTSETIARFTERPTDRSAELQGLLDPLGGKLEAYYFMFGEDDAMVIVDVPDSAAAAAISLAVSSSGAFGRLRTHELIPAADFTKILERAKSARAGYRPPGA
jgi:uncharacterized protein with GYD domain